MSRAFLAYLLLAFGLFVPRQAAFCQGRDANVKLPTVEAFIFEAAGKLVASDKAGKPLQIIVIPGDLVEVELINTPGLEPSRELTLALWESKWEWKEKAGGIRGFFGGKKTVQRPVKTPKQGVLGQQLVLQAILPSFPGASQPPEFSIKSSPSRQTIGMALQPGTFSLIGTVGSIQLTAAEQKPPHPGATRISGPTRVSGVGIEGQRLYHLQIHVTRPASNQGTP